MERYNIFNQVHKGLRAFLYDTALQVQQTDFTRSEEARLALDKINDNLHHFHQHALYVDRFLFPFIREYNPVLTAAFRQQYQQNVSLAQRLRGFMNVYDHAVSTIEKTDAGRMMAASFTSYLMVNLDYMSKEDSQLNSTLWRYYTDAELRELEKDIISKLLPQDLMVYSKWMIKGMSNTEIVRWLKANEQRADTYIFQSFFASAEKELPAERWLQVQDALAEGEIADCGF